MNKPNDYEHLYGKFLKEVNNCNVLYQNLYSAFWAYIDGGSLDTRRETRDKISRDFEVFVREILQFKPDVVKNCKTNIDDVILG